MLSGAGAGAGASHCRAVAASRLANGGVGAVAPPALPAAPVIVNGSFEVPALGPGAVTGFGAGSGWTGGGYSGIASNGSYYGFPPAPDGVQVAYLEINFGGGNSSASQLIDFGAGGTVLLTGQAARRFGATTRFGFTLDGAVVGVGVTVNTDVFAPWSVSFAVPAGWHVLRIVTTDPPGDYTTFLDSLVLAWA